MRRWQVGLGGPMGQKVFCLGMSAGVCGRSCWWRGSLIKCLKPHSWSPADLDFCPKAGSLACLTLDNFIQPLSVLVSVSGHLGCCNKNIINRVAYEQVYFSQFWRLGSPGSGWPVAYGIFLDQGSNQHPLQLQGRFLITGPPGKPWGLSFKGTNLFIYLFIY